MKEIHYKTITHFITPKTDFFELINQHHSNENNFPGICLSGLHTCGNLASSCFRIFNENSQIHNLCNIGCCYHLLCEESETDIDTIAGFPMSDYLKKQVNSNV